MADFSFTKSWHQHDLSASPINVCVTDAVIRYGGKKILNGVSFVAEPGEVLAIVGCSGSGKSSLLKFLTCRLAHKDFSGSVYFNSMKATPGLARKHCVYLSDNEQLLPYLTVYETFSSIAHLKLRNLTPPQREARISDTIDKLHLRGCRNTIIGNEWKKGLSTGERRRVALGIGLLSSPALIVADEPTTGLDNSSAYRLFNTFKDLSRQGTTVILTVNQVSSQVWSSFDRIMLMSNGQCYYYGEASRAKAYFASHDIFCPDQCNPADFFSCLSIDQPFPNSEFNINLDSSTISAIKCSAPGKAPTTDRGNDAVELFDSCISDITKSPDIFKLYDQSELRKTLADKINRTINNSGFSKDTNDSSYRNRLHPFQAVGLTLYHIPILVRRLFLNAIRNPIAIVVVLLTQLLQSIILGGIFWRMTAPTTAGETSSFDFHDFMNHPVTKLFVDGLDGQQPLLEFLASGVDGRGSQPFIDLLKDKEFFVNAMNIISCGVPKLDSLSNYSTYSVRPTAQEDMSRFSTTDDIRPIHTTGNLIGVLQVMDYLYRKEDWSSLAESLEDSDTFWAIIGLVKGDTLLNPWLHCAKFPSFKNYPPSHRVRKKRQLLSLNDVDFPIAVNDIFGTGASDFLRTTQFAYKQLTECPYRHCRWFNKQTSLLSDTWNNYYAAITVAINITSALFIVVANLGFASYDGLLTFPQQKHLMQQEIENRLYSLSSFFIAKNIAELPFQILPSFITASVFYIMGGLAVTFQQYMIYCCIAALVTFAAYGVGYLISSIAPRLEVAVLAAPIILVIWLTTAGYFLRSDQIPFWIAWFGDLSFYKWAYFSFILNQFPEHAHLGVLPNEVARFISGVPSYPLYVPMLILFLLGFAYRVSALLCLSLFSKAN